MFYFQFFYTFINLVCTLISIIHNPAAVNIDESLDYTRN